MFFKTMFFKININSAYRHLDSRHAPIVAVPQLASCLILEPSSFLETSIIKLSHTLTGFAHRRIHSITPDDISFSHSTLPTGQIGPKP